MSPLRQIITDVFALLGIGIVCFPLFLLLMPYIEQSRGEARIAMAYHDVRQLHDAHRDAAAGVAPLADDLPETDPWGQPYRIVPLEGQQMRVLSSGPNMSFAAEGMDGDDIYSDMPASPMQPIYARKNRQWLVAFAVTLGAWALLGAVYMRSRRRAVS